MYFIICSYEILCECWKEQVEDRPTFDRISDYLGKLLNGETTPLACSDEAAGCTYTRDMTRHIPENYADVNSLVRDDDYISEL